MHFIEEEHAEAHERLICLSTGKKIDDVNRLCYTKQEWLKTPEEMALIFQDLPEAIINTQEIVDKIEIYDINRDVMMPQFDIPKSFGTKEDYKNKFTEDEICKEFKIDITNKDELNKIDKYYRIKLESDYLRDLTIKGAKERYNDKLDNDIIERINFELDVIRDMGFPGYFLIVQDFIQAARQMNVTVGPGRGSAAGSVVAYCLKITNIDPLKYDLLFERFLNPDRISLPDIDIDFDDEGRAKILDWVTEKYGKEKVAHIITYGTMAAKSSIKDVARVQQVPLDIANRLAQLFPDKLPDDPVSGKAIKPTIANCIKYIPEIKNIYNSNYPILTDILKYANMLEGTVRQVGVHACGIIIGAEELINVIPISTAKDKDPIKKY